MFDGISKKNRFFIVIKLTSLCVVMIGDEASTGKLMIEAVAAFNSASYDGEFISSMLLLFPISIDSLRLASCRFRRFAASILKKSSRRCFFWVKNVRINNYIKQNGRLNYLTCSHAKKFASDSRLEIFHKWPAPAFALLPFRKCGLIDKLCRTEFFQRSSFDL